MLIPTLIKVVRHPCQSNDKVRATRCAPDPLLGDMIRMVLPPPRRGVAFQVSRPLLDASPSLTPMPIIILPLNTMSSPSSIPLVKHRMRINHHLQLRGVMPIIMAQARLRPVRRCILRQVHTRQRMRRLRGSLRPRMEVPRLVLSRVCYPARHRDAITILVI